LFLPPAIITSLGLATKGWRSLRRLCRDRNQTRRKEESSLWILADTQTLEEAIEQFNRQATWTYVDKRNSSYVRGLTVISPTLPFPRRHGRRRQVRQLLAVQTACGIELSPALAAYTYGRMDDKERPVYCLEFERSAMPLLQMVGVGKDRTTNLKHLDILLLAKPHSSHTNYPLRINLQPMKTSTHRISGSCCLRCSSATIFVATLSCWRS
jgi:hypothetical protein